MIEKLGRLQSKNSRVEISATNGHHASANGLILNRRGNVQVGVFNPLPVSRRAYPKIKVYSNNIAVTRTVKDKVVPLNITLVQMWQNEDTSKTGEYEMTVEVDLGPFELAYLNITDKPDETGSHYTE